jgi:hypothetical protein
MRQTTKLENFRKPVYAAGLTTASLHKFTPVHDKIMKNRRHYCVNSDIETFVITEINRAQKAL